MTPSRAGAWALVCSFAVYFIPIVGPHAVFFVFEMVRQQFRDFGNPAWAFSALGATFAIQAVAFVLFYWFWRTRGLLSIVAVVVYALGAASLAQFVYMLWLPAYFLIEADATPETATWTEACTVPDASMVAWHTPRRLPRNGWPEVWLSDSQNRQSVLTMPDCRRTVTPLPQPQLLPGGRVDFMIGITQVIAGGLALVQRTEVPANTSAWFLLDSSTGTLRPLQAPANDKSVAPYLADDGTLTAWILPVPGTKPPILEAVHLIPVSGAEAETIIDLSLFGSGSYEVVGVDSNSGDVLLWVGLQGKFLTIGRDGRERPSPEVPSSVRAQSATVLASEHGVLAWDAYKEDDNYVIAWSTDAGSGSRRIPRGSSITAATLDPSGRYVAFSTSTSLSIGSVRDVAVVLRASDGREVFRRFLPRYSRTNVAFIGQDYFAYSDATSTHVLRVPAS